MHSDTASRKQTLLEAVKWPYSVTPAQVAKLKTVVADYNNVLALSDEDLGCTDVVKHKIDTADHVPIKQYPRRTPFAQRAKIAAMIADLERKGVVSPSVSPWASPIVLVPKKDGTTRFCVDFRRLNAITKKDVYPLPQIEDILDTLGRAKYFTTLDLSAGYWQIQLDASSKEKTAFITHCGLFQFNRMPFGLCNAVNLSAFDATCTFDGRAKYFTTLDLSAGYWLIQLDASSKEKTAFTTHCGLFQFSRMPFGLCNAVNLSAFDATCTFDGRAKYFTTLDLSAGYWQIQLDASSKEKTAFTTHCGLFQFSRMPFGLCNAVNLSAFDANISCRA